MKKVSLIDVIPSFAQRYDWSSTQGLPALGCPLKSRTAQEPFEAAGAVGYIARKYKNDRVEWPMEKSCCSRNRQMEECPKREKGRGKEEEKV